MSTPVIIDTTKLPARASGIPGFHMVSPEHERSEWDHMWKSLVMVWNGDTAELNASFGECWQYMGTTLSGNNWEHVFRHRMHPRTKKREYFRVMATLEFHRTHAIPTTTPAPYARPIPPFDPAHCSGSFDGISVTSDADEGL